MAFRIPCQIFALATCVVAVGCKSDRAATSSTTHRPNRYDTTPIALGDFADTPKVQRRVLYMPFGEAAARLGSLELNAKVTTTWTAGSREHTQDDIYMVREDANENVAALLDTGLNQIELYTVNRELYIRQDHGHMRHVDIHDFQAPSWPDIAWSSIAEALEPFRPALRFGDGRDASVAGRSAYRYDLALAPRDVQDNVKVDGMPTTQLAVAPPAGWREHATPRELTGSLYVDKETGVPLKLSLSGRVSIDDDGRSAQLQLKYDGEVKDVGRVATVPVPESIPEYRIATPPADPVSFFREHLPLPTPEDAATKK